MITAEQARALRLQYVENNLTLAEETLLQILEKRIKDAASRGLGQLTVNLNEPTKDGFTIKDISFNVSIILQAGGFKVSFWNLYAPRISWGYTEEE